MMAPFITYSYCFAIAGMHSLIVQNHIIMGSSHYPLFNQSYGPCYSQPNYLPLPYRPILCAISGRTGPGQATQRCHVLPARGEEVADILLQETGITHRLKNELNHCSLIY